MAELDTNALFTQYVNVVNQALGENRDRVPYKQLLTAAEKLLANRRMGVAVYKDDPTTPHDFFTLTFSDGTFEVAAHGKEEPDFDWKVKEDHLRQVVENPEPYIQQPARLDLDWLKSRLNIG